MIPPVSAVKYLQRGRTIFRAVGCYDCVFREHFIPLFDSSDFISGTIAKVMILTVFVRL